MANLVTLRRQLVAYGQRMRQQGLIVAAEGNLSVRLGGHAFLVTPSGVPKGLLKVQDPVEVDLQGRTAHGTPTSEWPLHELIYRRRPEVRAVCHAHPPWATAMSVAGRSLDGGILTETAQLLPSVPLAPRAEPGTAEVPAAVAPLLADHDAVLLQGHGVVTMGPDLPAAFALLETVERLAQVTLLSELAAGRDTLTVDRLIELCRQGPGLP